MPRISRLTESDYDNLERSFITSDIADAARIYRVSAIDGAELVGRKNANCAGLVFPYRWPGEDHSRLDRLRLDNPSIDAGTGRPQGKYLVAPGSRNRLYLPPCDAALIGNVAVPLVLTEGEKKALALWRMALETANGTGAPSFLPVGLSGVWSFKGTIGIVTTPNGERVPEKGILPDIDRIALKSRRVTILFDANAATNPSVQAARRELARELTQRGAAVGLADLPAAPGVNGCDDYLYMFGVEKLADVLKHALPYAWRAELIVSDKGKALALLANAIAALRCAPEWSGVLAFDEFSLQATATRDTPWGHIGRWTEQDDRLTADWLQHHGIRVTDTVAAAAVQTVAADRSYHPVRSYLDSLVWDGIPRVDDWLALYLGTLPSDLIRAFARCWLISGVARIYQPGCKADHTLIVEGPQGALKSSAFRVIGGEWFTDDVADLGSKDSALATIGAWVIELSELDAMSRGEVSRVKSFISRQTDRFRPPYGRRLIEAPRQCIFVGTVNHTEYLRDETGGRRFWPVQCGRIDLDALRRDRDQLWAEAVARYRSGERWWLDTSELNAAAADEQDQRYMADAWEGPVQKWLDSLLADPSRPKEVTTSDLLSHALDKPLGQWTRADEIRIGVILRRLGWMSYRPGTGGPRQRMYRPMSNQK